MRNLEEFNGKHKGKICFVVGAGPSIYFQDLKPLKNHITIAINSGYLAVPWADYFLSDDHSIVSWSFFFRDLRKSKNTIALLYENKLAKTASLFGDRAVLFRHRKGIHIPDVYSHTNPEGYFSEVRNSVGSGIMAAHIMGASKIVLLGVDCCRFNGFRYFWQMPGYQKPYRNDRVPIDRYSIKKIRNLVTDLDLIDIARSWNDFGNAINRKGIKLYNASGNSILEIFPKAELKEFV